MSFVSACGIVSSNIVGIGFTNYASTASSLSRHFAGNHANSGQCRYPFDVFEALPVIDFLEFLYSQNVF